ncbi:ATP-binding protein [Arthrobacter sp. NIO-1057]|uniref:ATP-binding protein n=1 Tax=Arthrobacter sp. NIO-1057 TaxID=993071 RepID=UPI00071DA238|nr:ATP-binding protein [Arthrobacter sp. NIO-1057]KSU66000.1 hypothetical protein AS038_09965 [Arthrobacter sp. NIO-1057]SCC29542.1 two-component system, OmpR family, sensor histidine kinase KdpD [Arthrobacter sp. NIO-1057]
MDVSITPPSDHPLIVVALSGHAGSEELFRQALAQAARMPDAEVMAVHVLERGTETARGDKDAALTRLRELVEGSGATWHMVLGQDISQALLGFARSTQATHLVVAGALAGKSNRQLAQQISLQLLQRTTAPTDPQILIITGHQEAKKTARLTPQNSRPVHRPRGPRWIFGWILALIGPPLIGIGFLQGSDEGELLTLNFLGQLTLVVFVALLGGWWPAVTAALLGTGILNWYFTPPTGQWHIHEPLNVVALLLFLMVAAGVARVVDVEVRRTTEAGQARHQADTLFELSGGVIREGLSVPALLEWLCRSYALRGAALVHQSTGSTVALAGEPPSSHEDSDYVITVDAEHVLLIEGTPREDSDQGIFEAFAGRIAAVLQQRALAETRLKAQELSAGNAMRTALLAAVSHDLRTPLSGIKASVSSLRMEDVVLSEEDTSALLATIEESTDQLSERIEDLLNMSRIQAGELVVHRSPIQVEDLVASAVRDVAGQVNPDRLQIQLPEDCPRVRADYGLAVRVLANLMENAVRHGGNGTVQLQAGSADSEVKILVIDHGAGVPRAEKDRIFRPFQRNGDRDNTSGLGLGLAVARGLAQGMDGHVNVEDTPGGGATMVFTLPIFEEEL